MTWLNALATKTGSPCMGWQPKLCTKILHWLLSCADLVASIGVIPRKEQSSLILSITFSWVFLKINCQRYMSMKKNVRISLRLHSRHVTKICQSMYMKQLNNVSVYSQFVHDVNISPSSPSCDIRFFLAQPSRTHAVFSFAFVSMSKSQHCITLLIGLSILLLKPQVSVMAAVSLTGWRCTDGVVTAWGWRCTGWRCT